MTALSVEVVTTLRRAGCVFAEDEAALLLAAASTPADLAELVARRVAGQPLEYILGWAEFCGLRIAVEPGVFVPRRRTEFLVEQALSLSGDRAAVIDMCCGAGAIGAAIAAARPTAELYAVDIDPAAVRCARHNLSTAQVFEGDLFQPLPATLRGTIDLVLANAPYVPTDAIGMMPPEARLYEARVALDGGSDGLDVQRRITTEAVGWLRPGGQLLIESSERQSPDLAATFAAAGLAPRIVSSDEVGATVVIGRA